MLDTILAITSFIFSCFTLFQTHKRDKQNKEFRDWQIDFNTSKENIRLVEKQNDLILAQLNTRVGLIPHFHLALEKSDIIFDSKCTILKISLINVGKECACNIYIQPFDEDCKIPTYFLSQTGSTKNIVIQDYLNQYYALPKEFIYFKISTTNIHENTDFIRFKIRYYDLIDNLYEQEFKIGYDCVFLKGFNLNYYSALPQLIKK